MGAGANVETSLRPGAYVPIALQPSGGDDSSALAAALSAKGDVFLKAGATYKIQTPNVVVWDPTVTRVHGLGTKLDASTLSSGAAITVAGTTVPPYNSSAYGGWTGIELAGPGSGVSGVTGLLFNGTNSSSGNTHIACQHSSVHDFATLIGLEANTYALIFEDLALYSGGTVVSYLSGANSGERITFIGCTLFNSTQAFDIANGGDFYFVACSFDYNTTLGVVDWSSVVNLIGCHIEWTANSSTQLTVGNSANSGNGNALFVMEGGEIIQHGAAAAAYFASVPVAGSGGGFFLRNVQLQGVATTSGALCDAWHNAEVTPKLYDSATTASLGPVQIGGEEAQVSVSDQTVNSTSGSWVQIGTISTTLPNDGKTYWVVLSYLDVYVPGGVSQIVEVGIGTSTTNILREVRGVNASAGYVSNGPVMLRATGSGQVLNAYLKVNATISGCVVEGPVQFEVIRVA